MAVEFVTKQVYDECQRNKLKTATKKKLEPKSYYANLFSESQRSGPVSIPNEDERVTRPLRPAVPRPVMSRDLWGEDDDLSSSGAHHNDTRSDSTLNESVTIDLSSPAEISERSSEETSPRRIPNSSTNSNGRGIVTLKSPEIIKPDDKIGNDEVVKKKVLKYDKPWLRYANKAQIRHRRMKRARSGCNLDFNNSQRALRRNDPQSRSEQAGNNFFLTQNKEIFENAQYQRVQTEDFNRRPSSGELRTPGNWPDDDGREDSDQTPNVVTDPEEKMEDENQLNSNTSPSSEPGFSEQPKGEHSQINVDGDTSGLDNSRSRTDPKREANPDLRAAQEPTASCGRRPATDDEEGGDVSESLSKQNSASGVIEERRKQREGTRIFDKASPVEDDSLTPGEELSSVKSREADRSSVQRTDSPPRAATEDGMVNGNSDSRATREHSMSECNSGDDHNGESPKTQESCEHKQDKCAKTDSDKHLQDVSNPEGLRSEARDPITLNSETQDSGRRLPERSGSEARNPETRYPEKLGDNGNNSETRDSENVQLETRINKDTTSHDPEENATGDVRVETNLQNGSHADEKTAPFSRIKDNNIQQSSGPRTVTSHNTGIVNHVADAVPTPLETPTQPFTFYNKKSSPMHKWSMKVKPTTSPRTGDVQWANKNASTPRTTSKAKKQMRILVQEVAPPTDGKRRYQRHLAGQTEVGR